MSGAVGSPGSSHLFFNLMLALALAVVVMTVGLLLGAMSIMTKTKPTRLTDWTEQRTECARQNGHLWPDSFSTVWCVETATGRRLYKPRRKPRKSKIW